jgi:hypothetical protein
MYLAASESIKNGRVSYYRHQRKGWYQRLRQAIQEYLSPAKECRYRIEILSGNNMREVSFR